MIFLQPKTRLKYLFVILLYLTISSNIYAVGEPSWIAPRGNVDTVSSWLCLQKVVDINKVPRHATTRIAADSKYWLWINGQNVVTEGGVKRGPTPADSYCDQIDLAPYLKKGRNIVSVLVWYFGKPGFSYKPSGKAALFFDCPSVPHLVSDSSWKGIIHPAYYVPEGTSPNFRLPESNIGFNATKDIPDWHNKENDWPAAICRGKENDAPWGKLLNRMIPLWKDFGVKSYEKTEYKAGKNIDTIIAKLPYNAQITPLLVLEAPSGCRIGIRTDNYMGGGEPNVRAEYITAEGTRQYESLGWMNGEFAVYTFPKNVRIKSVAFRETGYDTEPEGQFGCSDPFFNNLWKKASRTLYLTMRDTYMDCPDRERAQW